MARIFISCFSEDLDRAYQVRGWLVEENHEVFLAKDLRDGISPGERWQARLEAELRQADAMVCVVTASYLKSCWCNAEVGPSYSARFCCCH